MQHLNDVPEEALEDSIHFLEGSTYLTTNDSVERQKGIEQRMREILVLLGYNNNDQHFKRTPERVAQVLMEFHRNGSEENLEKLLDVSFSDEAYTSLVQVGPITYTSMCAHHMLPVTGHAWVGYLPDGRVCGLSKLARVVDHFARQYSVQETVTDQIGKALEKYLQPKGVMVVVSAEHGCMTLRGVKERCTYTNTSMVTGVFREEDSARAEFLQLIDLSLKGKR